MFLLKVRFENPLVAVGTVKVCQTKMNVYLSVTMVDKKRNEKVVRCITLSSNFQVNCLDIDALEISFYEYKETHGPSRKDEQILE